jgi:hypothetical protein
VAGKPKASELAKRKEKIAWIRAQGVEVADEASANELRAALLEAANFDPRHIPAKFQNAAAGR